MSFFLLEKWIKCKICHFYLPSEDQLVSHQCGQTKGIKCNSCNFWAFKTKHLRRHSDEIKHINFFNSKCQLCSSSFKTTALYHSHMKSLHPSALLVMWHKCQFCDTLKPTPKMLRHHVKVDHENKDLPCNFCTRIWESEEALVNHVNKRHHAEAINDKWFKCKECQLIVPRKAYLVEHIINEHASVTIPCSFCSSRFINRKSYNSHVHVVHREEAMAAWIKCTECDTLEETPLRMRGHMKRKHKDKLRQIKLEKRQTKKRTLDIQCPFCSKKFSGVSSFHLHCNAVHLEVIEQKWLHCDKCKGWLPDARSMKIHQVKHNTFANHSVLVRKKIFRCYFCPLKLMDIRHLVHHCNRNHLDQILSSSWPHCEKCQLFFPPGKVMDRHNLKHSLKRDYLHVYYRLNHQCQFCSKGFQSAANYHSHVNTIHLELIQFTWVLCQYCGLFLPTKSVYEQHFCKAFKKNKNDSNLDENQVFEQLSTVNSEKEINSKSPNKSHQAIKTKKKNVKMVNCSFCPLKHFTENQYILHANAAHIHQLIADKWKPCPTCLNCFPNDKSLTKHECSGHQAEIQPISSPTTIKLEKDVEVEETKTGLSVHNQRKTITLHFQPEIQLISNVNNNNPKDKMVVSIDNQISASRKRLGSIKSETCKIFLTTIDESSWVCCKTCNSYFSSSSKLDEHANLVHNFKSSSEKDPMKQIDDFLRNQR